MEEILSTNLYWRPAPKEEPPADTLADDLKRILARKFWGHDGSLWGETFIITRDELEYLEGLKDAGIHDAGTLIAAIKAHGNVELWIKE